MLTRRRLTTRKSLMKALDCVEFFHQAMPYIMCTTMIAATIRATMSST